MVKKIPCILPVYHNDEFVSDIKKKCDLFNSYFAEQCTPLVNNRKLPSVLTVLTKSLLDSFHFSANQIGYIIGKLNPNKAYRHEMISIHILKLYGNSIRKPLEIIFENCLKEGIFRDEWKKANVAPVHKKNDINKSYYLIILSSYRPVSLFPVCSKIFECLINNSVYKYISDNNFLSPYQSGFCTGDPYINQLLSITFDILHSFDEGMETRTIF